MTVVVVGCSTRTAQTVDAGGTRQDVPAPITVAAQSVDGLVAGIYWTRPYGDPRPVSAVGYDDPVDGSRPYVLYGSITNRGSAAVVDPVVEVSGADANGAVVPFGRARVLDPHGSDLAILDAGATADVLFVLTDPAGAERLNALEPVLTGQLR